MKQKYVRELKEYQLEYSKELPKKTIWGDDIECDLETLDFKTFDDWTSPFQNLARSKISGVLNLIRCNKVHILRTLSLPILKWEKNLKSQKLWNSFLRGERIKPLSLFHHAIAHNATESMQFFMEEKECAITKEHLECAINNHAESALSLLLKHIELDPSERTSLIERACSLGNVTMVNMLFDGHDGDLHYFKKMIKTDKRDIYFVISLAYRNSNMQDVDKALQKYINLIKTGDDSQNILKKISQARQDFLEWGTQIAKYRKESDLCELSEKYLQKGASINLEKDVKFGVDNFSTINKILETKEIKIELTEDFKKSFPLPSDLKDKGNFYSMRALLRIFSEEHYQEGVKRGNPHAEKFKTLRESTVGTPCTPYRAVRYDHALPFIEAMFTLPDPDDEYFVRRPVTDPFGFERKPAYALMYKGIEMCGVSLESETWCHAKAPVKEIWPFIERLHAEVFSMSSAEIRENPQAFYNKVVEVIWLMGNLTPMERGTGRYVEQWLALVHKYHGLSMPILKPGLQLDCLNLTFSLPVYQKLFLNFCEPNSLEPFVAAAHQKQCETDPNTIRMMKHFKINALMPSEPFVWPVPLVKRVPDTIKKTLLDYKQRSTVFQKLHGISRVDALTDEKAILTFLRTGKVPGEKNWGGFFSPSGYKSNSLRVKIAKSIIHCRTDSISNVSLDAANKVIAIHEKR